MTVTPTGAGVGAGQAAGPGGGPGGEPGGGARAVEALLLAGAILPAGVETGGGVPTDLVRARRYRHPVLGDRVVVRLATETAAPGEDQALAFIGFGEPEVGEPLGSALRRGLGFPDWVLVNDPGNAHEALGVVKELERAARLARTKPGAAKDLFDALARQLTVPSHLPSFWEQAGRAYIAAGNTQHAATMFERAREAERVHALEVDEAARREVFLEFAFAGALHAKSLTAYAAELQRRYPPAEAYEAFLTLCVRRTLGGLPPWLGLPKLLRQLATAAGLDTGAEDERLVERLLPLPATRLAPVGFWEAYRQALLRLARRAPAQRGLLLNLFPQPPGDQPGFSGWWLRLLDDAGALDAVTRPAGEVAEDEAPARGAAAWLGQAIGHAHRGWRRGAAPAELLALIPRMVGRLRADGEPVRALTGSRTLDANAADACLEHGVPLADPGEGVRLDLREWLATNGDERRDLTFLAADPRYRELLRQAVDGYTMYSSLLDDLLDAPPVRTLVRGWAAEMAGAATAGGLLQAVTSVRRLTEVTGRRSFARLPEARDLLGAAGVAAPLARTLRGGLIDELGWPALEEALADLGGKPDEIGARSSWPVLVVHTGARAIAVGPGGRVAEHDLRVTNLSRWPWQRPRVWYAGGQFLVAWPDDKAGCWRAYWSGAPDEVFTPAAHGFERSPLGLRLGFTPLLPDGGRASGGRALYPGDRALPDGDSVCWDGSTFWALRSEQGLLVLRELDPRTGELGRRSLPSFLEAAPGAEVVVGACSLAPLPDGLEGTPLGRRDGMVGFRVTADSSQSRPVLRVEGVDGRCYEGALDAVPAGVQPGSAGTPTPSALVALPGAAAPLLLAGDQYLTLWDPELAGPLAELQVGPAGRRTYPPTGRLSSEGTPFGLPPAFWHCLRPRDEAGSAALRAVTDEQAMELLDAAIGDLAQRGDELPGVEAMERTARAVERALPEVTHPRLARGLVGTVRAAALLHRDLAALKARASAGAPPPAEAPAGGKAATAGGLGDQPRGGSGLPDGQSLREALNGLIERPASRFYFHGGEPAGRLGDQLGDQLTVLGDFFEQPNRDGRPAAGQPAARAEGRAAGAGTTPVPGGDAGDGEGGDAAVDAAVMDVLTKPAHANWPALLGRVGALAFRAVSPLTPDTHREGLLALLELWARLPFAADPGSFRVGEVSGMAPGAGRSTGGSWVVFGGSTFMRLLPTIGTVTEVRAFIERRAPGAPADATCLPAKATLVGPARRVTPGWGTPAQLVRLVELARARGPVAWDPAVPAALAARTGLTLAEAALLWAGLPNVDAWQDNFLDPARRAMLGLKAAEAKAARSGLAKLPVGVRCALLDAAMPTDPAALWSPLGAGPDDDASPVARMAAAWVALLGRRAPIPADALAEAARLGRRTPPATLLGPLLDPRAEPALATDRDCRLTAANGGMQARVVWDGHDTGPGGPAGEPIDELLADLAVAIPWAATSRPVGDPLQARLPEALALARARLEHPGLLLSGPALWDEDARERLRSLFGTAPSRLAGPGLDHTADDGLTVAVVMWRQLKTFFRPALLGDDPRSGVLRSLHTPPDDGRLDSLTVVDLLRSDGYSALAERVRATPVPDGGYEANPSLSVPELVGEVQARYGVDADAAALYLQLLTLLEPTDRNLRAWNGWTPARHRKALAALRGKGLVVEAKRERAGRGAFLPGGWVAAKAPSLPLEAWKLPLYGLRTDQRGGKALGPLPRLLPLRPLHELFAAAWARVLAGDGPGGGA